MSPSAKRNTAVLESSNKFQNPNLSNVIAPEAPRSTGGAPFNPEGPSDKPEKAKKRIPIGAKLGAAAAGLAIFGGAIFAGVSANNEPAPEAPGTSQNDEAPVEDPLDGNEAEPTAELWYETMNLEPTADDIRIDAATVAPEDVPAAYYNNLSNWFNAGYSTELADTYFDVGGFRENVATPLASQYDDLFIQNMVSSTAELGVNNVVNTIKSAHVENLMMSVMTSFPEEVNEYDKVPYMRAVELVNYTDLVVGEDGSITFTATGNEYDNADENSVGESDRFTGTFNGESFTQTVKLVVEDGAYKVSNITH